MATVTRPKPRGTARTQQMRRKSLIAAYLENYNMDKTFSGELAACIRSHSAAFMAIQNTIGFDTLDWHIVRRLRRPGDSAHAAFITGVEELVTKWRLDFLPYAIGYEAVLAAFDDAERIIRAAEQIPSNACYVPLPPRIRFSDLELTPLPIPDGTSPARPATAYELTVNRSYDWSFLDEKPADAKARIMRDLEGLVNRFIDDSYALLADAGYSFGVSTQERRYLTWLYRRVVNLECDWEILADEPAGSDGKKPNLNTIVRQSVEMQDALGISAIPPCKPTGGTTQ